MLGAIRYQPNRATLHTDTSLLPANRRAWASLELPPTDETATRRTLTYYLNRLQGFAVRAAGARDLNRDDAIDPRQVVARLDYAHPVIDAAGGRRPEPARLAQRRRGAVLRRLLGLRVPRGRCPVRAGRLRRRSARACERHARPLGAARSTRAR